MTEKTDKKAYEISFDNGDYVVAKIFWSESAGDAKSAAQGSERFEDASISELNCHRVPWADTMEDSSTDDLVKEGLKQGWTCWLSEDSSLMVTEKDIPTIDKVGEFQKFVDLVLAGKLKTADQMERGKSND